MAVRRMQCVNCGILGHSFRDCKEPVMSFGICAVKFIDNIAHYLLIRRRDSLAYVEFLRGKYKNIQQDYIQLLLNGMTAEERSRLLVNSFDTLWDTLWNNQNTRQYRNEYENAKRTFEGLKNTGDVHGRLLTRYIQDVTSTWTDPEWGFPKGRRTVLESELDCALREFEEETGFPKKSVHFVPDELPLIESYVGTNNIPYKQKYFVGGCTTETLAVIQPNNRIMNREVGGIGWFTYEEAFQKIRETNVEKRALLTLLHARITKEGLHERLANAIEWTTK
jgi:8-oxo-dGTP pyrophosphatase MutT (NUDIX family)